MLDPWTWSISQNPRCRSSEARISILVGIAAARAGIAAIHTAYPAGFVLESTAESFNGNDGLDEIEAEWRLRRMQVLQRAKKKLRALGVMLRVYNAKKARRALQRVVLKEVTVAHAFAPTQ